MEQKVKQSIPVLKQKFFSLIQENHYSEQYQNYLRFRFAALESKTAIMTIPLKSESSLSLILIKTGLSKSQHVRHWIPLSARLMMPYLETAL